MIIIIFRLFHSTDRSQQFLISLPTKIKDKKKAKGDQSLNKLNPVNWAQLLKDALEGKTKIKTKFEKCQFQHVPLDPSSPVIMELGYNTENCSRYCTKEYSPAISCKQTFHSHRRYHSTVVLISVLTASGAARDLRGNRSSLMFICSVQFLSTFHKVTESDPHPLQTPRQKATIYMDTLANGWHYG